VLDISYEDLHRTPEEEVTLPLKKRSEEFERQAKQCEDTYIAPNVKATVRRILFIVAVPC
jgi:hypothetical protein